MATRMIEGEKSLMNSVMGHGEVPTLPCGSAEKIYIIGLFHRKNERFSEYSDKWKKNERKTDWELFEQFPKMAKKTCGLDQDLNPRHWINVPALFPSELSSPLDGGGPK